MSCKLPAATTSIPTTVFKAAVGRLTELPNGFSGKSPPKRLDDDDEDDNESFLFSSPTVGYKLYHITEKTSNMSHDVKYRAVPSSSSVSTWYTSNSQRIMSSYLFGTWMLTNFPLIPEFSVHLKVCKTFSGEVFVDSEETRKNIVSFLLVSQF